MQEQRVIRGPQMTLLFGGVEDKKSRSSKSDACRKEHLASEVWLEEEFGKEEKRKFRGGPNLGKPL